jgi:hypothetical protein
MTRYFAVAAIAASMCQCGSCRRRFTNASRRGRRHLYRRKRAKLRTPGSEAKKDMSGGSTAGTSSDTSTGAKEQSSAPPGSAAADNMMKATDSASCNEAGGMWDETAKKCSEKKM